MNCLGSTAFSREEGALRMSHFCRQMGAGQEVILDDKGVGGGKVTFLSGVGGDPSGR